MNTGFWRFYMSAFSNHDRTAHMCAASHVHMHLQDQGLQNQDTGGVRR